MYIYAYVYIYIHIYICIYLFVATRASQTSARCSIDYCATTVERLSHARTVGWLRSVGSIQLWVSFAEYRLFYRALLQKKPIIYSILLTEAPEVFRDSHMREEFREVTTVFVIS